MAGDDMSVIEQVEKDLERGIGIHSEANIRALLEYVKATENQILILRGPYSSRFEQARKKLGLT